MGYPPVSRQNGTMITAMRNSSTPRTNHPACAREHEGSDQPCHSSSLTGP